MPAHRKYPDDLSERAIALVAEAVSEGGQSTNAAVNWVGEELGIRPATLRSWIGYKPMRPGVRARTHHESTSECA